MLARGGWDVAADVAMERYAAGEDAAFGDLYDVLRPRLFGFLRRRVPDDGLAEDLLQQTFLQMHRARGQFLRGARVAPWAFAIARNLLCDARQKWRVEVALATGEEAARRIDRRASSDPSAHEVLHAREVAGRLERVVSNLPASQRDAFQLIKRDGMSLAQAASTLGITVIAVKLRLHRAYGALQLALTALEKEGSGK